MIVLGGIDSADVTMQFLLAGASVMQVSIFLVLVFIQQSIFPKFAPQSKLIKLKLLLI